MAKRYPFNMNKHQHDIYFRYYRAKLEYDDRVEEGNITPEECRKYEELIEGLDRILHYGVGIVWLTGKEYGLARDTTFWADITRSNSQYR